MRTDRFFTVVVAGVVAVAVGSPAFAHIDPDPIEAQAGSEVAVGFTVQHGCDGSPTVQLDMRLPAGVGDPTPEPPAGWTGRVSGNIVTFEGGPLPDDAELTFRVRMILPPTPDTTAYFPFVQRCEVGVIRWIEIPTDGAGDELDEPAPAMRLFGPVATTQAAPGTAPSATPPASAPTTTPTVVTTATAPSTSPSATAPPATPTATAGTAPLIRPDSGETESGGSSWTTAFGLAIGAIAVVAVAAAVARRGRR